MAGNGVCGNVAATAIAESGCGGGGIVPYGNVGGETVQQTADDALSMSREVRFLAGEFLHLPECLGYFTRSAGHNAPFAAFLRVVVQAGCGLQSPPFGLEIGVVFFVVQGVA